MQFDHSPPPSFEIIFFPLLISLRRAGRSPDRRQGGSEDPPAKFFGIYDPKRCIFKAFSPVFYVIFDKSVCRRVVQWGSEDPPRKFLEFMTPKDAFLRPFSPFFYVTSDE